MTRLSYYLPSSLLIGTGLMLSGSMLFTSCGSEEEATSGSAVRPPMAVQVHVLEPSALDNAIITTGTLMANEEVDLVSELAGRITEIGFSESGSVSKGQVLLRINDDELQAQLRKVEANMKLSTEDVARKERLLEVSGISQEQFDGARAQQASFQAEIDELRARIAKCTIRAPFNGKVGLRSVSEGGYVSNNAIIAKLQQVDPIKIEFAVPERYGRMMTTGTMIDFTLEGDTAIYKGEVYAADPSVDAATRSVRVRARSANRSGLLLPGSFAKVEVRLERMDNALVVPAEALVPDIQGQKVLVIKQGKVASQRVQTGIRTGNKVQLTTGVQAGDSVLITGLLAVREGMPVSAIPTGAVSTSTVKDSTAQ